MSEHVDRQSFPQPDAQAKLWRYMDLAKLLWIYENKAIPFARLDSFEDPFEASIPTKNVTIRKARYGDLREDLQPTVDEMIGAVSSFNKEWRKITYVSCWHENEAESDAMWKLYASVGGGVAIRTTYEKLCKVLPDNSVVGRVKYINYDSDEIDDSSNFPAYMHKRISFAHEREVRAIFQKHEVLLNPSYIERTDNGKKTKTLDTREWAKLPPVETVSVDLNNFVELVRISPIAPKWHEYLVKSILARYGVDPTLIDSSKLYVQEPNW